MIGTLYGIVGGLAGLGLTIALLEKRKLKKGEIDDAELVADIGTLLFKLTCIGIGSYYVFKVLSINWRI